ncbi:MAG: S8 family serine peptidase [Chloroflexota bacterium]
MSRARIPNRSLAIAAAAILVAFSGVSAQAASPPSGSPAVRPARSAWDQPLPDDPSRLIVTFKPGTTAAARRSAFAAAGADRIADLRHTTSVTLKARPGKSASTMATLRADKHVASVSVDHRRFLAADPTSEPYWHELWGLENTGQDVGREAGSGGTPDVDIDGRQALATATGSGVVVAVIDDGVDFSHPDLAGRAWTNPGESGGGKETNGIDDDANGYIDDVNGWDFCHNDNTVHDFDDDFHGTHVAGTIAASLDGQGVVGVAPGVSIMALKFISGDRFAPCGLDSQAIDAITYAKSFGVRIANNSWGAPGLRTESPGLHDAIATSGMLFVAAAGNASQDDDAAVRPNLPAAFDLPNIVSVAAIDNTGGLAEFSDYGAKSVDIAAPGVAVLSALPADSNYPVGWGWLNGTSMATPHVTGTAALVASMWPSLAADPLALKARIMGSGKIDPITIGDTVSGRIVDAYRALDGTPPVASAPNSFGFVVGATMNRTSAATRVAWPPGTDDLTGVVAYGLQTQTNGGPWATAVGSTSARTAIRTLSFGTGYGFRVRARDGAGNWGAFGPAAGVSATKYEESSAKVSYSGTWSRYRTTSASAGGTRYATRRGATVTFRFTGRGFAVIAPKGPSRGSAKLYVDGHYISTVSLYRSTTAPRVIVAGRSWSGSAAHTVRLVLNGTLHHPRFDIDAFTILR